MASKIKTKKHQTEIEGRIIDLPRLAYDAFVFSAQKFQIPENCICRWEGEENNYGYPDFILVLSRVFLKYQITQRETSYRLFKSRHSSSKLDSIEKIQQFLQQVLKLSIGNANGDVLNEVLLALSVLNEIIIFFYSENCNLYLKELARFWYQYVSPMKRCFEKAGGFAALYKNLSKPKYDSVDGFYNEFIPEFCFPYYEPIVLNCLDDTFHIQSGKYFVALSENLPEQEKREYYAVMRKTVWLFSRHTVVSENRKQVTLAREVDERDEASGGDVLENTGLGIPKHEDLLREVGISLPGDEPSSQNLPGPSRQGSMRERRGSSTQEKRERKKTSSLQGGGKYVGRLDVGTSKSEQPSQKKN